MTLFGDKLLAEADVSYFYFVYFLGRVMSVFFPDREVLREYD
jgi:hypothetical protein